MSVARDAIERVRQPEYTGENRCVPCTATNLAITGVVALGLAVLWLPLAVGFAAVGAASVWLRGYLVPGTPELTKQYFPDWLLAKFDKQPAPEPIPDDEFDPERALLEAGAVEPCEGVDDLCLTDEFERAWTDRMDALADEDSLRAELAEHLDLDADGVSFESYGDAFVARDDGARVGQWESRTALLADLAAAKELPDKVENWEAYTPRARGQLLGGLRVFVETCPTCGGAVTADTETVESCCRSTTVVGVACEDCGDRLLEVPYDEPAA
ncbi:hypothetical protein HWV07_07820 [Natronomonas salina]|uniref:hypothetical protein n=1 Tax=Natronomonas salina TaxID=1710540 RepID=UPI0015B77F39|nr:hypothetical protein [Natronomonas salina]QLD88941.1 hypothetical protein HWV07_07820 [Natronomonas salina]